MRSLKFADRSVVNFFTDPVFAPFKSRLDAVMEELHTRCGRKVYSKVPVGRNIVQTTVKWQCGSVGVTGHYTNHSI